MSISYRGEENIIMSSGFWPEYLDAEKKRESYNGRRFTLEH